MPGTKLIGSITWPCRRRRNEPTPHLNDAADCPERLQRDQQRAAVAAGHKLQVQRERDGRAAQAQADQAAEHQQELRRALSVGDTAGVASVFRCGAGRRAPARSRARWPAAREQGTRDAQSLGEAFFTPASL